MKNTILFFTIFLIFTSSVFSNETNSITIIGNKRISSSTITEIIQYNKNKKYNLENLNNFQKKLFNTNFFSSVNISLDGQNIKIEVTENPLIDFFYIKGVKNKGREDFFYNQLSLGQNKIFSESNLKLDIDKIIGNYKDAGYYNVNVKPIVTSKENNLVNLVIEVERNEKIKINRIFFIGDKFFKSSTLSDVLLSSEYGWWKLLTSTSAINEKRIEYDEELLRKFYLDNGFLNVQILSTDINFIDKQNANITFSINSGKKHYFSENFIVDNNNNLTLKNKEYIKKIIAKKLKGTFSQSKINFVKEKIYDYLNINKIEFVGLNILIDSVIDEKVNLKFIFKNLDNKYVNLIKVKGNSITEEKVIRNNLSFSEGDSLAEYKISKSKDNLNNTGIFKNVQFKFADKENNKTDIDIILEEIPTGSISAGVGVGTAESSVSAGLVEKNLFGKGITLNSDLSIGTERVKANISTIFPDFKNSNNDLSVNLYTQSTDFTNSGYESSQVGTNISTKYEIYENIFLNTGVGIDHDKVDTNAGTSALYKSRGGNYATFKGFYNISKDERNRKFQPTGGYIYGFGQGLALPGSDITYLENNIFGNYYHSLNKDYVLRLRSGLDTINALNDKDIKLSDRKSLSSRKLRGFESYGVGPKDGKDHVGGNYSAYASISSTIPNPFPEKWNAKSIIFLDNGNVWGVDYNSSLDSNKIRSSAGLSLDWISPLGPISFTYAEIISSANGDIEENFNFQIGSSF